MNEWHRKIQATVNAIDEAIKAEIDDNLTLHHLAEALGYSPYHVTRVFHSLTGMPLREYLYKRKLAFALVEVRDTDRKLLDIAIQYGFSSHEAFTCAFKRLYGLTPRAYRRNPVPVVLCSKLNPLDRYLIGQGVIGMLTSGGEIKIYFTKVPAHKFLHIKSYESNGYFDFWEKYGNTQDCDAICGLLDSIKGKLDGDDSIVGQFSGQIMGFPQEGDGRRPEAYGIRLPVSYSGPVPDNMIMLDVPAGEYIVFEHGAFDFETQCNAVYEQMDKAISEFNWKENNCQPDPSAGRIAYYYFDPDQFLKRVLPVRNS